MFYRDQIDSDRFECFDNEFKVKPGYSDPGGELKLCGEAITHMNARNREIRQNASELGQRITQLDGQVNMLLMLRAEVQTQKEIALIRRCGELEAELALRLR